MVDRTSWNTSVTTQLIWVSVLQVWVRDNSRWTAEGTDWRADGGKMQNAGTTPWHRNTTEKTRKDRTGGGAVRSNLAHPPDRSSEAIDKTKSRIFPSSPEFCSTVRMSSSPRRLDMSAIMRYSLQCKRAPRNENAIFQLWLTFHANGQHLEMEWLVLKTLKWLILFVKLRSVMVHVLFPCWECERNKLTKIWFIMKGNNIAQWLNLSLWHSYTVDTNELKALISLNKPVLFIHFLSLFLP